MKTHVSAFAPASVSNVAAGFDIMGFALDQPGDTVTIRLSESPGVRITKISGSDCELPRDPARNTAGAPVLALARMMGYSKGLEIEIHKGLSVGSGLGSSAASAVAAAVACNAILQAGLSNDELLPFAIEGEKIASEAVHVDNLAPCLWGGFILVRGYHPIDVVHLRVPHDLWCTVIHPHIEIETKESRKLLPRAVPLVDVVTQTGNAAGLVAGLLTGDLALLGRSLHDVIAEPVRGKHIPGFAGMKEAALKAGALGCSISGSGPALFALCDSKKTGGMIGAAMGQVLDRLGCPYDTYVSTINCTGARVLD